MWESRQNRDSPDESFKNFQDKLVNNQVHFFFFHIFQIKQISNKYGIEQAHKRSLGFKADFFSVLADALTTECVFLDGAAHQVNIFLNIS